MRKRKPKFKKCKQKTIEGIEKKQELEGNFQNKFNQKPQKFISDCCYEKQAVKCSWICELFVNILKIQKNS